MKKALCVGVAMAVVFGACAGVCAGAEQKDVKRMKPALIVIDVQNEWLQYMAEQDKKFSFEIINGAITRFREHGFPVIRVYHTDLKWGPKPDTEPFEFPSSVLVKPEDPKVVKNYGNSFKKTGLDKILHEKGCNTVFLCGLSATGCVLATYMGAEDLDYDVFMIKDALLSHDATYTNMIEDICDAVPYSALKVMLENLQN